MSNEKNLQFNKPVICAGEILCDFISKDPGKGLGSSGLFEKRPGGAPFNIAVGIRRLGIKTAFLSKIGGDQFGTFLTDYLKSENLLTDYVVRSHRHKTTLAFAAVDSEGKPEFTFYQDHPANTSLIEEELPEISPEDFSLFQFGSIALLQEPAAATYLRLFERFRDSNVMTSFDPNVRPSMIPDRNSYIRMVLSVIRDCDIVKMSDDDLGFLTTASSVESSARMLPLKSDGLLIITLGRHGAGILYDNRWTEVSGFNVRVAETTGCGDAFTAGLVSEIIRRNADYSQIGEMVSFANACAAIVATRVGAANAMPYRHEVVKFLQEQAGSA